GVPATGSVAAATLARYFFSAALRRAWLRFERLRNLHSGCSAHPASAAARRCPGLVCRGLPRAPSQCGQSRFDAQLFGFQSFDRQCHKTVLIHTSPPRLISVWHTSLGALTFMIVSCVLST